MQLSFVWIGIHWAFKKMDNSRTIDVNMKFINFISQHKYTVLNIVALHGSFNKSQRCTKQLFLLTSNTSRAPLVKNSSLLTNSYFIHNLCFIVNTGYTIDCCSVCPYSNPLWQRGCTNWRRLFLTVRWWLGAKVKQIKNSKSWLNE